jgi:hypothetical protein
LLIAIGFAVSASALAQGIPTSGFVLGDPMTDSLRDAITRVVVMPGASPTSEAIGGSYDKETYGLEGGMVAGSGATTIYRQAGPVNVAIPIPILQLPAMIAGGIAGATQEEIQEFRDALTDELADASSQQLVNDKITSDVYNEIRTTPGLDAQVFARETPIPDDTDAVLYVGVEQVLIDVDGNEAIITASVNATVTRHSDDKDVYETTIYYQDRDTLGNWTENDNAAWRNYANFARHYVGREIASRVFESAGIEQVLVPAESGDVRVSRKNSWDGSTKKRSPTLGWQLHLPGGENDPAWASSIDESNIFYELEIYELQRPVYVAGNIRDSRHTVTAQLEPCKHYRWSVRPAYHVDGKVRYGPWMRSGTEGNGNIGTKASEAPAYLYDFAEFEVRCGSN